MSVAGSQTEDKAVQGKKQLTSLRLNKNKITFQAFLSFSF